MICLVLVVRSASDDSHYRGCLNNPIFPNLGLCAACWACFMCHHELWPTSVSHPFSSLNNSLGFTGGKHYQKIIIPIFRLVLQNFAIPYRNTENLGLVKRSIFSSIITLEAVMMTMFGADSDDKVDILTTSQLSVKWSQEVSSSCYCGGDIGQTEVQMGYLLFNQSSQQWRGKYPLEEVRSLFSR